jgi:hypothetical protein
MFTRFHLMFLIFDTLTDLPMVLTDIELVLQIELRKELLQICNLI